MRDGNKAIIGISARVREIELVRGTDAIGSCRGRNVADRGDDVVVTRHVGLWNRNGIEGGAGGRTDECGGQGVDLCDKGASGSRSCDGEGHWVAGLESLSCVGT